MLAAPLTHTALARPAQAGGAPAATAPGTAGASTPDSGATVGASTQDSGATVEVQPPVASGVVRRLRVARSVSLGATRLFGLGLAAPARGLPPDLTHLARVPAQPANAASVPTSVDLSRYDPPIGDQGQVNSCASWATGYTLLGWYANRYGDAGAPYAPMYAYAQLVQGVNTGTSFEGNFGIEEQGIDTQADYFQGNYDYTDQPTSSERANAAHYHITGYTSIYQQGSGNAQQAIEAAMAAGQPVVVGIPVYSNFMYATAAAPFVDVPPAGSTYFGGHGIVGVKYDAKGLWIQNQWGTTWGLDGLAELSWAFVNQDMWSAYTITGFQAPPAGSIPPTATPAPGQPTATPATGASITVSPSSALPGTLLTISGSGLGAGAAMVYWNGGLLAQVGLSNGGFTLNATLSTTAAPGPRTVSANNTATGQQATTTFTVLGGAATATPTPVRPAPTATRTPLPTNTPTGPAPTSTPVRPTPTSVPGGSAALTLSPGSGAPGANITVFGNGFHPSESVRLYWNGGLVTTLASNSAGGFMYPLYLSLTAAPGPRAVLAQGNGDQAGATFTVLP